MTTWVLEKHAAEVKLQQWRPFCLRCPGGMVEMRCYHMAPAAQTPFPVVTVSRGRAWQNYRMRWWCPLCKQKWWTTLYLPVREEEV